MNKLIVALPYHTGDHASATRLLNWIAELDPHIDHHLLLVADAAVPPDIKKALDALGKSIFASAETILPKCPAPVNGNYHAPAAVMFERTMAHIDTCHRWNFLWMEPDCVPLKSGWLDTLAEAYDNQPKRFMGSTFKTAGGDLPATMFFATAIYPNCSHPELKQFCDGRKAFDVAFSDYVVPRGVNSKLFFHCFGAVNDPPTFKEVKLPADGPNVGELGSIPKEAVLMHRNKDGSLIDLLRRQRKDFNVSLEPMYDPPTSPEQEPDGTITKRRSGRPPRHPTEGQMP